MKKYNFKHMNIKEFEKKYNIDINGNSEDFYIFLLNKLDDNSYISYFSSSLCDEDVIQDIEEENPYLNLELIEVNGVYLALY